MIVWVLFYDNYEDSCVENVYTEEGKEKKNAEMAIEARKIFQEKTNKINHDLEILRKKRALCCQQIQGLSKLIKQTKDEETTRIFLNNDKKFFLSSERKLDAEINQLEKELLKYSESRLLQEFLKEKHLVWISYELIN